MSTPWRVRAMTEPGMSAKDYRDQLIHETPAIEHFLSDMRGEKLIVSAPKGFGKTLVLTAKALQVQESGGGLVIGAGGQIVDRPNGVFPNFSQEKIKELRRDYSFWRTLWKVSIMAAAVKFNAEALRIKSGDLGCDEELEGAILDPILFKAASDFFTYLVCLDTRSHARIVNHIGRLERYFSAIQSPTVMVIDNVDEYFKPLLEDATADSRDQESAYYRQRSNEIWTLAQVALAGAAYEAAQANSHVKIYCSIRREASLVLSDFDDQVQQFRGAMLSIEYDATDYERIFDKNIRMMSKTKLVAPRAERPIARFLGEENHRLSHRIIHKDESAFGFILRHTLYRPRDLMVIGEALANRPPESRRRPDEIRRMVGESSKGILEALLAEMRPFFPLPNLEVLLRLTSHNAMPVAELEGITHKYLQACPGEGVGGLDQHPFCILHKIGLLGTISRGFNEDQPHQNFLMPYEITIRDGVGLPATHEFYLIHPALDQLILDTAGLDYLSNFDTSNIVGDGLPWAEPLDSFFVLKGDVCGFSEVMTSEFYPLVVNRLSNWTTTECANLHYYDVIAGDSVVLVDHNAARLLRSAQDLARVARDLPERSLRLRFGGSAGPISFHSATRMHSGVAEPVTVPLGLALRQASRIEPFAIPGEIWIDDAFMKLAGSQVGGFEFVGVTAGDVSLEVGPGGGFLVRKNSHDPANETQLWRLSRADS